MEYFFSQTQRPSAGVHITIFYANDIVISRSQLTEFWKVIKSDNYNPGHLMIYANFMKKTLYVMRISLNMLHLEFEDRLQESAEDFSMNLSSN